MSEAIKVVCRFRGGQEVSPSSQEVIHLSVLLLCRLERGQVVLCTQWRDCQVTRLGRQGEIIHLR